MDTTRLPEYTINFVTTSTSYRTRGFVILENISFSSSPSGPYSMTGIGFGDAAPEGLLPVVAISGLYLGVPVPIMCSYSCNFEVALMGDCILSLANGLARELDFCCSAGGDAR